MFGCKKRGERREGDMRQRERKVYEKGGKFNFYCSVYVELIKEKNLIIFYLDKFTFCIKIFNIFH